MKVLRGLKEIPKNYLNVVATVGIFDGLHLGHQKLILRLRELAREIKGTSLVLTFDRHPHEIITGRSFAYLNTLKERIELFRKLNLDILVVVPFDEEFRRLSPEEFVSQVLHDKLRVQKMVVGGDFRFGHNRQGDFQALVKLGKKYGFEVESLEPLSINGQIVSSSYIRELVKIGALEESFELLGYHYSLTGKVRSGTGLGRKIGFPTANLRVYNQKVIPANGIYACYVNLKASKVGTSRQYQAVVNIGTKPTIPPEIKWKSSLPGTRLSIEVHLLDFEADLYLRNLTVKFVRKLRQEQKFPTLQELAEQIKKDISEARNILHPEPDSDFH